MPIYTARTNFLNCLHSLKSNPRFTTICPRLRDNILNLNECKASFKPHRMPALSFSLTNDHAKCNYCFRRCGNSEGQNNSSPVWYQYEYSRVTIENQQFIITMCLNGNALSIVVLKMVLAI